MDQLNELRILAGIGIKQPANVVSEAPKPALDIPTPPSSSNGALKEFWVVTDGTSESELGDVMMHVTNFMQLVHWIQGVSGYDKNLLKTAKVFTKKAAAMKEAQLRLQHAHHEPVTESTGTYGDDGMNPDSWEPSDKMAVNHVVHDKDLTPDWNDKDMKSKDLNGVPADKGPHMADNKISVPAEIKSLLTDKINSLRQDADKPGTQDGDILFLQRTANAFQTLLDYLKGGTEADVVNAQVWFQSLMGPMQQRLPNEVIRFLAHGGKPRSLKDMFYNEKGRMTSIPPKVQGLTRVTEAVKVGHLVMVKGSGAGYVENIKGDKIVVSLKSGSTVEVPAANVSSL